MSDIAFPGGGKEPEPGFDAVRGVFGEDMVQRIRNWPVLTRNHALAQGQDASGAAAFEEASMGHVERARMDKDYAVTQAAMIARNLPRVEWLAVPSVAQLRRSWGLREDLSPLDAELKISGAAAVRRYTASLDARAALLPATPSDARLIAVDEEDVEARKAAVRELKKADS